MAGVYQTIVPQAGRYPSRSLGLDLMIEDKRLLFLCDGVPLPTSRELVTKLSKAVTELTNRSETFERRVAEETARRDEERRSREIAELRLAEALAELRRWKGEA